MITIHKMSFPISRQLRFALLLLVLTCEGLALNGTAQEPVRMSGDKPMAVKVFEIGKVSNREFARGWKRENWGFSDWITQLYIINYGSDSEVAYREKVITNSIGFRNFDRIRITFLRGGRENGARTVVWKVPTGADSPQP